MDIQKLVDTMNRVSQDERSKYQLTLGRLTRQLEQLVDAGQGAEFLAARAPDGALMWLGDLMSYRGYYSDLAFEPSPVEPGWTADALPDIADWSDDVESWLRQNPGHPRVYRVQSTVDNGHPALCSTVRSVLERCRLANGEMFEGYKGGDYTMDDDTPLWLAKYGEAFELALMPTFLARDYPHVYVLNTIRPDGDLE